ncbi:DUF2306 domain-containing protein [Lacimicrobium sp. SS2-24]|uniref:DUF2306 domain-containing protein n=1 Tax=Lacimicrobium sp. SS2-24 TaxID=2005569 RepID=UPI00143AF914|nr:DUF2306 domain-containing protein [Lacimicrobium sp. SS2-24]
MQNTLSPALSRPIDWLSLSAKCWYVTTFIGQSLFVLYIFGYFGIRFFADGVDGFAGTHLPNGFIQGDGTGNTALAAHILIAALIISAGLIQLLPNIRKAAPRLHRYSGWFYMLSSIVVSLAGMYLVWSRDRIIGSFAQDIGVTGSGVLVIVFVCASLYFAIKRNIAAHRRWALRLFMVVSAVWFLRLMIFGWLILTGGVGIDMRTFSGPFLIIVGFAQYLVPLAILEIYFRAQQSASSITRNSTAALVLLSTLAMAVGLFAITQAAWLPRIGQ